MLDLKLEVVRFGNEDVIATSGGVTTNMRTNQQYYTKGNEYLVDYQGEPYGSPMAYTFVWNGTEPTNAVSTSQYDSEYTGSAFYAWYEVSNQCWNTNNTSEFINNTPN